MSQKDDKPERNFNRKNTAKAVGSVTLFSKALTESYKTVNNLLIESSDLIKSSIASNNSKLTYRQAKNSINTSKNLNRVKTLTKKESNKLMTLLDKKNSEVIEGNTGALETEISENSSKVLRNSDNSTVLSSLSSVLSKTSNASTIVKNRNSVKTSKRHTTKKITQVNNNPNNAVNPNSIGKKKMTNNAFKLRLLKVKCAINTSNKKKIKNNDSNTPSSKYLPYNTSESPNNPFIGSSGRVHYGDYTSPTNFLTNSNNEVSNYTDNYGDNYNYSDISNFNNYGNLSTFRNDYVENPDSEFKFGNNFLNTLNNRSSSNKNSNVANNINIINNLTNPYKNPNETFLNIIQNIRNICKNYKGEDLINIDNSNSPSNNTTILSMENQKLHLDKSLKIQNFGNDIETVHFEASNLINRIDDEIKDYKPVNVDSLHYSSTLFNIQNIINNSTRRVEGYKSNFDNCISYIKDISELVVSINNKVNINNTYITNNSNVINNITNVNNVNNVTNVKVDDNSNEKSNTTINNNINNNQNIGGVSMGGININLNVTVNNNSITKESKDKDKDQPKKKRKHHKNMNKDSYIDIDSNTNSPQKKIKTPSDLYHKSVVSKLNEEKADKYEKVNKNVKFESFYDYDYADVDEYVSVNQPHSSLIDYVKKNNESSKILKIYNYDKFKITELMQDCLSEGDGTYTESDGNGSINSENDYSEHNPEELDYENEEPIQYPNDNGCFVDQFKKALDEKNQHLEDIGKISKLCEAKIRDSVSSLSIK